MLIKRGNLWDFMKPPWNALIVIPTNIGWRKDGRNVMGRGLAREASLRYKGLAEWYGSICRAFREDTPVVRYLQSFLLLAPSKGLARDPALSWSQKSDLRTVARSIRQLSVWHETTSWEGLIAVPLLGCGNGGLSKSEVWPLLRKHLGDDRFVVVERP